MRKFSEFCALGHPDRTCDQIACALLDEYIRRDRLARVALECQVKDNFVTLGGEVTTTAPLSDYDIERVVTHAIADIGYTPEYARKWGDGNTLDAGNIHVLTHIGSQSPDIAQGVNADGWGDQGVFCGMATGGSDTGFMSFDYYLARKVGEELYEAAKSGVFNIGLDIKTQIVTDGEKVVKAIVAAPMIGDADKIEWTRKQVAAKVAEITGFTNPIINGTGAYVRHASMGDCGTTGRKLAVDFYGLNSPIGGGCPWGKDPSKADVSLNIYARMKALEMLEKTGRETVFCKIECCIGRKDITITYTDEHNDLIAECEENRPAPEIIDELGLYAPVFAWKNAHGLFALPYARLGK